MTEKDKRREIANAELVVIPYVGSVMGDGTVRRLRCRLVYDAKATR